jgi:hypothetical protein
MAAGHGGASQFQPLPPQPRGPRVRFGSPDRWLGLRPHDRLTEMRRAQTSPDHGHTGIAEGGARGTNAILPAQCVGRSQAIGSDAGLASVVTLVSITRPVGRRPPRRGGPMRRRLSLVVATLRGSRSTGFNRSRTAPSNCGTSSRRFGPTPATADQECALEPAEHLGMTYSRNIAELLLQALDPTITRNICALSLPYAGG